MGQNCFSPITHGYPLERHLGDKPFEWWMEMDKPFLDNCKGVIVLMFEGWEESPGVTHEIEVAKKTGKLILYQDVS